MHLKFLTVSACLLMTATLIGCAQTPTSSGAVSTPAATAPSSTSAADPASPASGAIAPSAAPISQPGAIAALVPGEYCYQLKTDTLDGTARLTLTAEGTVVGETGATIQNPSEGYFSSYTQSLNGVVQGNQLQLRIVTRIEDDVQETRETWRVTDAGIDTGRETYTRVDCSVISGLPQSEANPTVITRPSGRVEFAPGSDSAVIQSAVVRGERNSYALRAAASQTMSVRITSLEDNAVFDVVAPRGQVLQQEAMTWSGSLPANGDYSIVVGGTRGNATYELTVQIQ